MLIAIEATLKIRRSAGLPQRVFDVVPEEDREKRTNELSHQGYSVFSWPIDEEPFDDEEDE